MRRLSLAALAALALAAAAPGVPSAQSNPAAAQALVRIDELESEIRRLTSIVERLDHELRQVKEEQKSALLDLEFRIIELEGGDPSILFEQDTPAPAAESPPPATGSGDVAFSAGGGLAAPLGGTLGQLSVTPNAAEKQAYDDAVARVQLGDYTGGRAALVAFVTRYPDGIYTGDAQYWLGETYFVQGDYQSAASSYLDGYTLHPGSERAPDNLIKLGVTLTQLGQTNEACLTFAEVAVRFPTNAAAADKARAEARRAGCS